MSSSVPDANIAAFLAAKAHCQGTQNEIARFIRLAKQVDQGAVLLAILNEYGYRTNQMDLIRVKRNRVADLRFTDKTLGTRGASINLVLPSLLWALADQNCKNLRSINDALEQRVQQIKDERPPRFADVDDETLKDYTLQYHNKVTNEKNFATSVAQFLATHESCQGDDNQYLWHILLAQLSHAEDLSPRILETILQSINARNLYLPKPLPHRDTYYLSGGLGLKQRVQSPRNAENYKYSIVWALLDKYCSDQAALHKLVNALDTIFREHSQSKRKSGGAEGTKKVGAMSL